MAEEDMRLRIREIMEDSSLTDAEKAEARQKLFMGTAGASETKLAGKSHRAEFFEILHALAF